MKKLNFIFLTIFLILVHSNLKAQIVNIPDTSFKSFLINHVPTIDSNGDNEIQLSEAQAYSGGFNLVDTSISNLIGIEEFTALTSLNCPDNEFTTLDISSNINLTSLNCSYNQLTTLDVSNNLALTFLSCDYNQLTSLDISNNLALTFLNCSYNILSNLDIHNNTSLNELRCINTQLSTLQINNNIALIKLNCDYNQLTTLDVSNNINLTNLGCSHNQLTSLDISNNIDLNDFFCNNNQLISLDVSSNTTLNSILCNNNQLTTLDCSNNTSLTALRCDTNQLTSLDIRNGNNTNFSQLFPSFGATSNPSLTCIAVDTVAYFTTYWSNFIDSASSFSTDCSNTSTISIQNNKLNVNAFPNPTTKSLYLDLGKNYNDIKIEVSNILGRKLFSKHYEYTNQIQLELGFAKGIYLIEIQTEEGESTIKVIKD